MTTKLRLEPEQDPSVRHAGGTVTYRVYAGELWIGWIGDGHDWCGHRYGARKWWACWRQDGDQTARARQDGDQAVRANSHLTCTTRTAAVDWLQAAVAKRQQTISVSTAANELRALHVCRQLEQEWGIRGAIPAYNAAEGGYTGQVALDAEELMHALATASEQDY